MESGHAGTRNCICLLILLVIASSSIFVIDFVKCEEEKTAKNTYLESIKLLLQKICEQIDKKNWEEYESLIECYNSSIYLNEYLWLISSFTFAQEKLNNELTSIMVLPNSLEIKDCIKVNEKQCITKAIIKKENGKIFIEYSDLDEIVTPILNECNVKNPHVRSSLNTLWLGSNNKLAETARYQSLLVGKGYAELFEFGDLFGDLSALICSDVKKYIYSDVYRSKIKSSISNIINSDKNGSNIQDPIYVRIPIKYDFETQLDEGICQRIKNSIPKLDECNKLELHIEGSDKRVVLNNVNNILTECEPNESKRIITWKIH
ncbi:hypothetical protein FG386_001199 [Cryptosporidium ryanae]|uniref:uncharacterized protein n=1 Tax=Cryptosporidium ryanae TaxID=515981 RepID=UPI00351A3FC4|nr:hypothetical protein FG386_001199 [Cryptosporidium ryanae]